MGFMPVTPEWEPLAQVIAAQARPELRDISDLDYQADVSQEEALERRLDDMEDLSVRLALTTIGMRVLGVRYSDAERHPAVHRAFEIADGPARERVFAATLELRKRAAMHRRVSEQYSRETAGIHPS